MKSILIAIPFLLVTSLASAQDTEEIRALFTRYLSLFNDGDSKAIAEEIYSPPAQFDLTTGPYTARTTAEIENIFDDVYERVKARGWTYSELRELTVCVTQGNLAFVNLRYSRTDGTGRPIPPNERATLYVVRRIDAGWRIIGTYTHNTSTTLSCEP